MKVKKKLKGKGFFVNEDLTWSNQQLYKRAREIVKDLQIHSFLILA